MITPIRKEAIKDLLARLDHRQDLLLDKCSRSLIEESGLSRETALALVNRWAALLEHIKDVDNPAWQRLAVEFGAWCAAQKVPFEVVMAHLHSYRRLAMPLLVREYPGVEGYLEAHLALDEALALLMGKIPGGYYGGASA